MNRQCRSPHWFWTWISENRNRKLAIHRIQSHTHNHNTKPLMARVFRSNIHLHKILEALLFWQFVPIVALKSWCKVWYRFSKKKQKKTITCVCDLQLHWKRDSVLQVFEFRRTFKGTFFIELLQWLLLLFSFK